jgi:hypothetical protein
MGSIARHIWTGLMCCMARVMKPLNQLFIMLAVLMLWGAISQALIWLFGLNILTAGLPAIFLCFAILWLAEKLCQSRKHGSKNRVPEKYKEN